MSFLTERPSISAALLHRADECQRHAEASFFPKAAGEYRAKEAAFREAAKIAATPAAPATGGVPGWQLVPIEPTEEMLKATEREWDGRMSFRSTGAWKAMLAAAPAPPITEQPPAAPATGGVPDFEQAVERMVRALPVHADRVWDHNPIQETEREWMRPILRAALATPPTTSSPAGSASAREEALDWGRSVCLLDGTPVWPTAQIERERDGAFYSGYAAKRGKAWWRKDGSPCDGNTFGPLRNAALAQPQDDKTADRFASGRADE